MEIVQYGIGCVIPNHRLQNMCYEFLLHNQYANHQLKNMYGEFLLQNLQSLYLYEWIRLYILKNLCNQIHSLFLSCVGLFDMQLCSRIAIDNNTIDVSKVYLPMTVFRFDVSKFYISITAFKLERWMACIIKHQAIRPIIGENLQNQIHIYKYIDSVND